MSDNTQFIRKYSLIVWSGNPTNTSLKVGIDLSAFRIHFNVQNSDVETPNNASIRVYNLSQTTINNIQTANGGEYKNVTLSAGYENGNFGVIFQGTIRQYKIGRENNKDTYLDILAADGDVGYNQGFVNTNMAAGTTIQQRIATVVGAMPGLLPGYNPDFSQKQFVTQLRGRVLFGMARAQLSRLTSSLDYTWSIQNGQVNMIPKTGYLPSTPVKINRMTGLVGLPEQTDGGIKLTCLLNSGLRIGGLVQLNNDEIQKLMQQNPDAAPIAYNQWAGFQYNTPLSKDGFYRAYVVEHEGDSRGGPWYSNLICLAVKSTDQTKVNTSVAPEH